jgi:T5SS/PEP-CTERM-associated repeat protein
MSTCSYIRASVSARKHSIAVTLIAAATSLLLPCVARAEVLSIGAVSPVPPVGGGTFSSSTQLLIGEGDDDTEGDIWGYVSINNGTLLQYGSLIVGDEDGYFGQVNVSSNFFAGQISQFNFSAQGSTSNPTVQIGREGTGWLNLSGGSTMNLTNNGGDLSIGVRSREAGHNGTGVGYATVKDQFTIMTIQDNLFVGQFGIGTLDVLNGAIVRTLTSNSSSFIGIGTNDSGVGLVKVDGQGSVLRAGSNLVVSGNSVTLPTEFGQGTLRISNGGIVDVDNGVTFTNEPRVIVGPRGRIELDEGSLFGFTPALGFGITVDGFLGGSGLVRGSVALTETAFLESHAGDFLRFTGNVDNQGSLTIDNSEMWFLADFINNAPALGVPPGRIALQNGTVRFAEPLINDGVISSAYGTNDIHGEVINNERVVVARDTVASFYGDFTNNGTGTVTVLPGGNALFLANIFFTDTTVTSPGPLGLVVGIGEGNLGTIGGPLSATGSAALAGRLEIELDAGFVPEAGNIFEIVSADGGITGTFDSITFPPLPTGLEFGLIYGSNTVTAEVRIDSTAAGLPGDYNNDGTVDASDYTVWRDKLGSTVALANDDTPGVGQDDYTRWVNNFGQSLLGGGVASSTTPEPTSCLLALLGLAMLTNPRAIRSR